MVTKNLKCAKIVSIKTFSTERNGSLSFFESSKDIPFSIKRVYFISGAEKGAHRGFHAHKKLKQLLFCPFGTIKLVLDDGKNKEEIVLDNQSIGVLIEKPVWREMIWTENDSVLCVAASDYYNENDYIRDYSSFMEYIKEANN